MIEHAFQGNVRAHSCPHGGDADWLTNKIHSPHLKSLFLTVCVNERRDEDNRNVLKFLTHLQPSTHFQTIHVWHHDIQ